MSWLPDLFLLANYGLNLTGMTTFKSDFNLLTKAAMSYIDVRCHNWHLTSFKDDI